VDQPTQKSELRREIRQRLKGMTDQQRRRDSQAACDLLRLQQAWIIAQRVLFYAPMPDELDVSLLLAAALAEGKTVALPGFVPQDKAYEAFVISHLTDHCAPGKFGIAEPKSDCARLELNQLDFVLAPGVGFDSSGHRLGRGRGFYDRLLAKTTAIKCGVAFDLQIVERIPAEAHDIRMDCLLTPTRWQKLSP